MVNVSSPVSSEDDAARRLWELSEQLVSVGMPRLEAGMAQS
jgi:hypothetical protein